MEDETPSSELARLRNQQHDIPENEVYGGLSKAERAEYEAGAKRIDELTRQMEAIALSAGLKQSSDELEQIIRNADASKRGSPALPQPREGFDDRVRRFVKVGNRGGNAQSRTLS
jgi:hypothetical protein